MFCMALMAKGKQFYINIGAVKLKEMSPNAIINKINIIHIPIHIIANYEQVRVVLGLYSPITYSSGRKWIGYIFESNKK